MGSPVRSALAIARRAWLYAVRMAGVRPVSVGIRVPRRSPATTSVMSHSMITPHCVVSTCCVAAVPIDQICHWPWCSPIGSPRGTFLANASSSVPMSRAFPASESPMSTSRHRRRIIAYRQCPPWRTGTIHLAAAETLHASSVPSALAQSLAALRSAAAKFPLTICAAVLWLNTTVGLAGFAKGPVIPHEWLRMAVYMSTMGPLIVRPSWALGNDRGIGASRAMSRAVRAILSFVLAVTMGLFTGCAVGSPLPARVSRSCSSIMLLRVLVAALRAS